MSAWDSEGTYYAGGSAGGGSGAATGAIDNGIQFYETGGQGMAFVLDGVLFIWKLAE